MAEPAARSASMGGEFEAWIQQLHTMKEVDLGRYQMIEELLGKVSELNAALENALSGRDDQTSVGRLWRNRAEAAEFRMTRNQFALVLIDGNNWVFRNVFDAENKSNPSQVVDTLVSRVRDFVHSRHPDDVPGDMTVVICVFANMAQLVQNLSPSPSTSQYQDFIYACSRLHPFFSFIDCGPGKDVADEKIKESFELHFDNCHCRHLILALAEHSAYLPALHSYCEDEITLAKTSLVIPKAGFHLPLKDHFTQIDLEDLSALPDFKQRQRTEKNDGSPRSNLSAASVDHAESPLKQDVPARDSILTSMSIRELPLHSKNIVNEELPSPTINNSETQEISDTNHDSSHGTVASSKFSARDTHLTSSPLPNFRLTRPGDSSAKLLANASEPRTASHGNLQADTPNLIEFSDDGSEIPRRLAGLPSAGYQQPQRSLSSNAGTAAPKSVTVNANVSSHYAHDYRHDWENAPPQQMYAPPPDTRPWGSEDPPEWSRDGQNEQASSNTGHRSAGKLSESIYQPRNAGGKPAGAKPVVRSTGGHGSGSNHIEECPHGMVKPTCKKCRLPEKAVGRTRRLARDDDDDDDAFDAPRVPQPLGGPSRPVQVDGTNGGSAKIAKVKRLGFGLNRQNERIDLPHPLPSEADRRNFQIRNSRHKMCIQYHVSGACGISNCAMNHEVVEDGGVQLVLLESARKLPCKRGPQCREPACRYGHHCHYGKALSVCSRTNCPFAPGGPHAVTDLIARQTVWT